ncbi:MAG TPA: alkaline phosphatase family protein [Kiritimatiellia bacterium]|nr:alkaline phosphatase family protein [Kiritimatiellia bacterium]HMP33853.1 alkaline phosphatase family protein [Kiritimatiellia bacterium]
MATPTILIALDGATFTVLEPLMKQGVMPFLRDFVAGGVKAPLMSTVHPLTPPAFVSMYTGRTPGNHGVFDFTRVEDSGETVFFPFNDSRNVRCETIWAIANRQNRKAAVFNFVVTSPVNPFCGVMIPGLVQWKYLKTYTFPTTFYEKLKEQPWFNRKALCWDLTHERDAVSSGLPVDQLGWVKDHIEREEQWFQVFRFMMDHEPTDLMAMVLDGVDKLQHVCWEFLDPALIPAAPDARQQEVIAACHAYFRKLDDFLRSVREKAGPEARIILTSDHGFGPTEVNFNINQMLHELGYLHWQATAEDISDEEKYRSLKLDWNRTVAYCPRRSTNGVYIRVSRQPGQPGIPAADYDSVRERIAAALRAVVNPLTGQPMVKAVATRDEAFPGAGNAGAPDLNVVLGDHGFVSTAQSPEGLVTPVGHVIGTHYPEGILIANGAGVARGKSIESRAITDVAPLVLYSLGLPIPSNFEGVLPTGVFEPAHLAAQPPVTGEPAFEEQPAATAVNKDADIYSQEEKDAVYEQLRALGYVE